MDFSQIRRNYADDSTLPKIRGHLPPVRISRLSTLNDVFHPCGVMDISVTKNMAMPLNKLAAIARGKTWW
jgi:hypothetical protein